MPDWVGNVIAGVATASFLTACAAAWIKVAGARHKNKREVRGDEIDVLHRAIEDTRKERDKLAIEVRKDRDKIAAELADLRSEHSVCRIELERLKTVEKYFIERDEDKEQRIKSLEAEMTQLRARL